MTTVTVTAYTYNAAAHCPDCTSAAALVNQFARVPPLQCDSDVHGITADMRDSEGNPIHAVFSTDENADGYCDTCGLAYGNAEAEAAAAAWRTCGALQLADALRVTLIRADEEHMSLLELGRDDEDTAEEATQCGKDLDSARAILAAYDAARAAAAVRHAAAHSAPLPGTQTADKLAAALRALSHRYTLANPPDYSGKEMTAACEALAEYDAAQPDPLTIAYIAIGAQIEYRYSNGQDITGQSEYIDSCIQHAPMLDRLAPQVEETGAHFYYEFAEAFGARYGAALLAGKTPGAAVVAAEILAELPQS